MEGKTEHEQIVETLHDDKSVNEKDGYIYTHKGKKKQEGRKEGGREKMIEMDSRMNTCNAIFRSCCVVDDAGGA